MGIPSIDRATQNLVKWAARGERKTLQRKFFEAHLAPVSHGVDLRDDAFEVLPGDGGGMLSVFVLEEFFTARFGGHGELNVVDDYLKRRGWRESMPARRHFEALRDSTLSLYEVIDIVRRRHMTVRSLILGGTPVRVDQNLGSQGAVPWSRLAARIVPVHGKHRFTDAILRFRHELSRELLTALEMMAGQLHDGIRSESRKRGATAPVTRELACEVMVRIPLSSHGFSRSSGCSTPWCGPRHPRRTCAIPTMRPCFPVRCTSCSPSTRRGWLMYSKAWKDSNANTRARHVGDGSPQVPRCTTNRGICGDNRLRSPPRTASSRPRSATRAGSGSAGISPGRSPGHCAYSAQDTGTGAGGVHGTGSGRARDLPSQEALKPMHSYFDDDYLRPLDESFAMLDGKALREAPATSNGLDRALLATPDRLPGTPYKMTEQGWATNFAAAPATLDFVVLPLRSIEGECRLLESMLLQTLRNRIEKNDERTN